MIIKTFIAAAALITSLVAVAPEQAKADVDVHFGVNLGGYPGFHPGYGYGGFGPAYPVYSPGKISCHQGKQSVKWSGFKMVSAFDCQGPTYRYRASKSGNLFRVSVNAWSGDITNVKPW